MRERDAQAVMLVRAIEEGDPHGRVWPESERDAATRRAFEESGAARYRAEDQDPPADSVAAFVGCRARLLLEALGSRYPAISRALSFSRGGAGLGVAIIGVALVAGLATNALGPRRQINLLAFPLLGLLLWNIAAYALMLAVPLIRRLASRRGRDEPRDRVSPARRLAESVLSIPSALHARKATRQPDPTAGAEVVAGALSAFAEGWRRVAGPILAARMKRTLHLSAVAMVAGAIGGMYLRGLVLEYRATWESTLLDAAQVQRLLGWILGPAATILGSSVPDVAPLRAPQSGDAALWIHLYALTALITVVAPRLLLAALETLRAHRLAGKIPIDLQQGYYLRLLAGGRGGEKWVDVIPYSFRLDPLASESLKKLLLGLFGSRAHVVQREPVEYGADPAKLFEDGAAAGLPGFDACRVVLFNLAQTPEREVHGRFLAGIRDRVGARGETLLALADRSRFLESVASPERRRERMETWSETVAETGVALADVDLRADGKSTGPASAGEREDPLTAVAAAVWPSGASE